MQKIENCSFEGERALFKRSDLTIVGCRFHDGESPLKEGRNIETSECSFEWKYPMWYGKNIKAIHCRFEEMARAGMWYDEGIRFEDCLLICPKGFRRSKEVELERVEFVNAEETLWECESVSIKDVKAKGSYLLMNSKKVSVDNLDLVGNYPFDGCEDIEVSNSRLISKDAFWNCKRVVVRDSYIEGEYFGWNSEDVTLINCEIRSHQGFCYMSNIKLVNCKVVDSDLTFEYCKDIDADILTSVDSVKNPISGRIKLEGYGELIFDDPDVDPSKTKIEKR